VIHHGAEEGDDLTPFGPLHFKVCPFTLTDREWSSRAMALRIQQKEMGWSPEGIGVWAARSELGFGAWRLLGSSQTHAQRSGAIHCSCCAASSRSCPSWKKSLSKSGSGPAQGVPFPSSRMALTSLDVEPLLYAEQVGQTHASTRPIPSFDGWRPITLQSSSCASRTGLEPPERRRRRGWETP